MIIKKGSVDVSAYVVLVDSAAGTPKTGLTITNIDATYTRTLAAAVKNDLTALAATTTAHTDNKGIEIESTNAPGLYRIDFPDAAFATGADKVILSITCSGAALAHLICELVNYDPADAAGLGLTNLDATVSSRSTLTQTQVSGGAYALNSSSFAFNSGLDFTTTQKAATLARVTLTDTITTYTGNTVQTGDSYAKVNDGTIGLAAIKGYVDDIGVAGAGLTAIPWNATWDAEVQSECADALVAYAPATATALATVQTSVDDLPTNAELATSQAAADDATLAAIAALNNLSQANIRTAVGLASANLDTQLSTIDDFLDTEVAAIKLVTDHLGTAIELDGSVYRFTTNALEQAPAGGGGGGAAAQDVLEYDVTGDTPADVNCLTSVVRFMLNKKAYREVAGVYYLDVYKEDGTTVAFSIPVTLQSGPSQAPTATGSAA